MSTTAYRRAQSPNSFARQHIRMPSTNAIHTMTNNRTRNQSQINAILPPQPPLPVREPLSRNSVAAPPRTSSLSMISSSASPQTSTTQNLLNESSSNKTSKQTYLFSNPPRDASRQSLQQTKYLRNSRWRQRVSSAPDENSFQNSPRSVINQQKPSSANDSATPRSHEENSPPNMPSNKALNCNEQQKTSLNALIKEQERSNVPKAVQKRRIILLFRRIPSSTSPLPSPRQQQNSSPVKINDSNKQEKHINDEIHRSVNSTASSDSSYNDPFQGLDQAEIADSKQIAAILANIQSSEEWFPNQQNDGLSPRQKGKNFDPKKYEYVANNSLDTATFKLSPRTLKPHEESAALSRYAQNYRYEMLASANAQIPPLMASIVTENNSTIGIGTGSEKSFTFKLNPATTMKKQNSLDEIEPISSTIDGEQIQLCFDEILKGSFAVDVVFKLFSIGRKLSFSNEVFVRKLSSSRLIHNELLPNS